MLYQGFILMLTTHSVCDHGSKLYTGNNNKKCLHKQKMIHTFWEELKRKKRYQNRDYTPSFSFISIQFSWIRRLIIQFYFNFQLFQLCFTGYIHAHSKFICHVTIGTPTPREPCGLKMGGAQRGTPFSWSCAFKKQSVRAVHVSFIRLCTFCSIIRRCTPVTRHSSGPAAAPMTHLEQRR